jgi:hypothetical protein
MLQLLLERGQSYDDLASILGVSSDEVRSRARAALTDLGGADPDRNVALTDYLLGQADPIDRADAVRHLKDDPEDLALVTELAQKLRLVAPEAELPRLPGEERQPRQRGSTRRRLPKPLKKLAPAPEDGGAERPPRTSLSRRQTQGIVIAACAAVLVGVGVLAIAGVFSSGSSGSTTTTDASGGSTTPQAGSVQGYPLLPITAANSKGQGAKLDSNGNFQDSLAIPNGVQSILPNVQAVVITLADNAKVAQSIQKTVQTKSIPTVTGRKDFVGIVGTRKGKVFPIQLQSAKNVKGSGTAALGLTNNQPFFQIKLTGLEQPPNGSSYIVWLAVGASPQKQ